MAYSDLLVNVCAISRYEEGDADAYGVLEKTWGSILDDEPCRLSNPGGREIKVGAEVVIADYKLFLAADVDVTEQDRVIVGTGVSAVTYEVLLVNDLQDGTTNHHLEVFLRTVQ